MRIDRKRKQSVTHFLKAVGMTESEIRETFAAYPVLLETLEKDTVATQEEALLDIYRKLRPGEPANVDAAQTPAPAMARPSRSALRSTTSTTSPTVASAPSASSSRVRSAPASPAWSAPCASA